MPKENNKMQVDIDTLKKQNVNDLLSIKEIYSKLEELGEKITKIKYIDNTLVKKLKKEYENLKKIILDENIQLQLDNKIDEFNLKLTHDIETINSQQVKLNNDIETVNSQLDTNTNKLDNLSLFISDYPKLNNEQYDDERFKRVLDILKNNGGGVLNLENERYIFSKNLIVTENIVINGKGNRHSYNTEKTTILEFVGSEGDFITVNSYYTRKSTIKNLNIIHNTSDNESTAIKIVNNPLKWGGSLRLNYVNITGFYTGVYHIMTYQVEIDSCNIFNCEKGLVFNPNVEDADQEPLSSFGNVNTVKKTSINQCKIGVDLNGDMLNIFESCDIEKCRIGIQIHSLGGRFAPPQGHVFENCWFENNGWEIINDKIVKDNPRYIICNSDIDDNYNALGTNSVSLPKIINARSDANVFPQIPPHNSNYELYSIKSESNIRNYFSDESVIDVYNKSKYTMDRVFIGNNGSWRTIYELSNKGLIAKVSLNEFSKREKFNNSSSEIVTRNIEIDYSSIINPDLNIANKFSSMSIMGVHVDFSDGSTGFCNFIINDFAYNRELVINKIGDVYDQFNYMTNNKIYISELYLNSSNNNKKFTITVEGKLIRSINIKMNFLPNGTFLF